MIAQTVSLRFLDGKDALQMAAWLIAAVLVTGAGMFALKRWLKRLGERPTGGANGYNDIFPLEAMDKLLADGEITPEEYRRLRRVRLGLKPEKQPPADSGSSPPAPDVDAQ